MAKNKAKPTEIAAVPTRKLRPLNRRRSMIGSGSVSSQITKNRKLSSATTPSAMITGDANQSRSLPLSSMICSAATQVISDASPTVSIGSLRTGDSRSR
ncbi:hypothetical protein D3C85_1491310 [compost metagenome]